MTPTECAQLIVLKEVLQQLRQVWEENAALDAREIERQRIRADLAERKLAIVAQALSEIAEGKKSTDLCSNDGQTFLLMAGRLVTVAQLAIVRIDAERKGEP